MKSSTCTKFRGSHLAMASTHGTFFSGSKPCTASKSFPNIQIAAWKAKFVGSSQLMSAKLSNTGELLQVLPFL
jgi:hypothetical protein